MRLPAEPRPGIPLWFHNRRALLLCLAYPLDLGKELDSRSKKFSLAESPPAYLRTNQPSGILQHAVPLGMQRSFPKALPTICVLQSDGIGSPRTPRAIRRSALLPRNFRVRATTPAQSLNYRIPSPDGSPTTTAPRWTFWPPLPEPTLERIQDDDYVAARRHPIQAISLRHIAEWFRAGGNVSCLLVPRLTPKICLPSGIKAQARLQHGLSLQKDRHHKPHRLPQTSNHPQI